MPPDYGIRMFRVIVNARRPFAEEHQVLPRELCWPQVLPIPLQLATMEIRFNLHFDDNQAIWRFDLQVWPSFRSANLGADLDQAGVVRWQVHESCCYRPDQSTAGDRLQVEHRLSYYCEALRHEVLILT